MPCVAGRHVHDVLCQQQLVPVPAAAPLAVRAASSHLAAGEDHRGGGEAV